MAEVRCPMCGMQNSADKDICSFCNARLKPVLPNPEPDISGLESPDWLQSLRGAEDSPAIPKPEEEPLPDWLIDLRDQSSGVPREQALTDDIPSGSKDYGENEEGRPPDWLRNLISESRMSDEPDTESTADRDFFLADTGWLRRIDEKPDDSVKHSSEYPDQLTQPEKTSSQKEYIGGLEQASWLIEESKVPEDELPDWLSDKRASHSTYGGKEESQEESQQKIEQGPFEESLSPGPVIEEVEEERFPEETGLQQPIADLDWLDKLKTDYSDFSLGEEEISSAMGERGSSYSEKIPEETLPSWLLEPKPGMEVIERPSGTVEEEHGLAPAELPGWLQAMRPIEPLGMVIDIPSGVETEKAEVAGPLAGLRGVLPAEPDISPASRSQPYSMKLQITEAQRTHANLLERMIKAEDKARPLPTRPAITSQHLLRYSIAGVLLLAILFPIMTGVPQVGLPIAATDISATVLLIEGLPAGAPVLFALDYDPGMSGEMDVLTSTVIGHLINRGAYLAIVSTTMTGPLQAEHLLAYISRDRSQVYRSPDNYVNLGIIPGGSTGLLRLSEAPRSTIPFDIRGKPAWNNPLLKSIERITDFSMVVVSTENPDTARSWVEQVQPGLLNVPFILVVSAQAEPVLRPYFESNPRQVQGLVGGLAGGVVYQSLVGNKSQASVYWPSFSVSMMFAGLLIAVGGIVNLAFAYAAHRRENNVSKG